MISMLDIKSKLREVLDVNFRSEHLRRSRLLEVIRDLDDYETGMDEQFQKLEKENLELRAEIEAREKAIDV